MHSYSYLYTQPNIASRSAPSHYAYTEFRLDEFIGSSYLYVFDVRSNDKYAATSSRHINELRTSTLFSILFHSKISNFVDSLTIRGVDRSENVA